MPDIYENSLELRNASDTIAILQKNFPKVRRSIERGVSAWNKPIRDILRSESGFRLTRSNEEGSSVSVSVSVTIIDGLPIPFHEALKAFSGLEWLLAAGPMLNATKNGLDFLAINQDNVSLTLERINLKDKALSADELSRCIGLLKILQQTLDKVPAIDNFVKEIHRDIFGAFFLIGKERIEIYWVAIAIFSLYKGIDPEALTIVVLAHELAHAYTIIGRDIDGGIWDRDAIFHTDLDITEGIAQHYTEVVCERIYDRYPKALEAFLLLREVQSKPYTGYTEWYPDDVQTGEALRASILTCRTERITKITDFQQVINENLRGRPTKVRNVSFNT